MEIKKKIENVVIEKLIAIMKVDLNAIDSMPGSIMGFAPRAANVRAVANYLITKTRRHFTEDLISQDSRMQIISLMILLKI